MVARMMKWRPWPPAQAGRKVEARLVVRRVEGVEGMGEEVAVEVKWKGGRMGLGALRRGVKRNWTREEGVGDGGVVVWDEEFRSVCSLTAHKENAFQPWEIGFTVFSGLNRGPKKLSVIGTASLNLAEFVSAADVETEINLPLLLSDASPESHPTLNLTLSLLELRTFQELEVMQRCMMPVTSSPPPGESLPLEKDELSALKAGLRKVKILSDLISTRKAKKTCRDDEGSEGKCSTKSEDGEYAYPFDSDSLDDDDANEIEESDSSFRKSFSYGPLASANFYGGPVYSDLSIKGDNEDWIHYSHQQSDVGLSNLDHATKPNSDQSLRQTSKRSILNWKKRKLSFRSPKAKGEPLLKKGNGDEGGDDIDFDRRQLSSSDESYNGFKANDDGSGQRSSFSEFGDDNFVVGNWESKKFESRDGQMKLFTQVFFASIDQRSERAAGESACTALVAVIADWFQSNADMMPIKSQFDSLIREGSLEWRNLCENQIYRELFPDKHFDLETVLQAKIRPLSVNPGKSFIGFFRPEGTSDNNSGFDFLHGAMSFDNIWDEISQAGNDCPVNGGPKLYIVSWNDHFFVLKVEQDAYYIIDTLGERLYEGCNQAYILKFDENTSIFKNRKEEKSAISEAGGTEKQRVTQENITNISTREDATNNGVIEEEIVCRGKEACKEYIKSFLAAIPIRELQADINKGLRASTPLHHRLQIEFHYTEASKQIVPVTPMSVEPIIMSSCRPEPEAAATFTQSANLEVEVV